MIGLKDLAIIILLLIIIIMGIAIASMKQPHFLLVSKTSYPEAVEEGQEATKYQHVIEYMYNGEFRVFETYSSTEFQKVLKYLGVK